jgi:predicted neutral ceramidase superfamily lipid hydrolase
MEVLNAMNRTTIDAYVVYSTDLHAFNGQLCSSLMLVKVTQRLSAAVATVSEDDAQRLSEKLALSATHRICGFSRRLQNVMCVVSQ